MKEINALAIPAILSGIAEPLIGLLDTAIIGHSPILPKESLAAVGLGSQLFLILFWIFIQTETSLSSIIGRSFGEKTLKQTEPLIGQGIALNFGIGIILFALSNLFLEQLFDLYQAKGTVRALSIDYYRIRSFGFPIALCTWMIWGVFRGLQNTSWAMWIGVSGGVMNLILDLAFVYGIEGYIEPMGVKGAAWGSLIAQLTMLIVSLIVLYKKTELKLIFQRKIHPQFGQLLKTGRDFILRALSLNAVIFMSNSFCTKYGDDEIAAHTLGIQLWVFAAFMLDGYANAGQAMSSRFLGSGKESLVRPLLNRLIKISLIISVIAALFLYIGKADIGYWFIDDLGVAQLFEMIVVYIVIFQPINGFAFTYDGILKGTLQTAFIRNMMIAAAVVFTISLLFFDYYDPGIKGVWISLSIWMVFRYFASMIYLRRKFRV